MAEKGSSEVPRDLRDLYHKGHQAFQRNNLDYAIAIFNDILAKEPGFFECRQALRATQVKRATGKGNLFRKLFGGAKSSPQLARAQMTWRKHPIEAIRIAEQVLEQDPFSTSAHRLLAEAALEAGFPKTACLELEILLKSHPEDEELSLLHARALQQAGQIAKAEETYLSLVRAHPLKGEYAMLLKNLSAQKTMLEKGYDALATGSGSYRDILANEQAAVSLEQEGRAVKTADVASQLIQEYEQRLLQEPGNLRITRSVAELYAQKKDFVKALEYYDRIKASTMGNDPSLDQAIADTRVREFDHAIEQLDPASPEGQERKRALQAQRAEYQLSECKQRVERYPNDLVLRYDLARLYQTAGELNSAIQEFQRAQASPHRRIPALLGLGECFAAKGAFDIAVRRFQEALKEKLGFDEERKAILYALGLALEKLGKRADAMEYFKQIYEVDITYRDVAEKVDQSYRDAV